MPDEGPAAGEAPLDLRVHADARCIEVAVPKAARRIFATPGVDASVREVAAKAGVGVGPLHRRFPQWPDLVADIVRREVDSGAAEAEALAAAHPLGEALALRPKRHVGCLATKRGLAAALHFVDPALDALRCRAAPRPR